MVNAARDIFDDLDDIFDEIASELKEEPEPKKSDIFDDTADITSLVKAEMAKVKPTVQKVIERVVQPYPVHLEPKIVETKAPPQIVKEVRVEVEKKDKHLEAAIEKLEAKIADLQKELEKTKEMADHPIVIHGGPGVIGIPAPEPNPVGHVLTINDNKKAEWKAGGGGASISGYTVNNSDPLKTFDVADTSLDELARVVGTLLSELQA